MRKTYRHAVIDSPRVCGDKIEIKKDKESKRECFGGEHVPLGISVHATSCARCFLNLPTRTAGVQSSKLSAQPANEGKYIHMPDTKDNTDESLVGVVSAESTVTSLHSRSN